MGQFKQALLGQFSRAPKVQVWLVAARPVHPRAWIVGNDQFGCALIIFKRSDMAFHPVAEVLAQRSSSERVGAGTQGGDKQGGGRDLGSAPVVEGNRIAGPIYEHLFAGVMLLPQHHILVAVQRSYSSQKRLTCAAAHVSRYVAAVFMLRDHLKAMTVPGTRNVLAT